MAWGPAVEGGYIEVVQTLLTKLKEANLSGLERQWGLTLTLVAAAKSDNLQLVRLLLEAGAAVNIPRERTYIGMTAIQAAAERGHQEVVKLLLERGADCEVSYLYLEGQRNTAIRAAIRGGNSHVVQLLAEVGAKINALLASGIKTLLEMAIDCKHSEVVNLLIRWGAMDLAALERGELSRISVYDAVKWGHLELIKGLLQTTSVFEENSHYILQLAAKCGHYDVVQFLLAKGIPANGFHKRGCCCTDNKHSAYGKDYPIYGAVQGRHLRVVELLLDAHASTKVLQGGYYEDSVL